MFRHLGDTTGPRDCTQMKFTTRGLLSFVTLAAVISAAVAFKIRGERQQAAGTIYSLQCHVLVNWPFDVDLQPPVWVSEEQRRRMGTVRSPILRTPEEIERYGNRIEYRFTAAGIAAQMSPQGVEFSYRRVIGSDLDTALKNLKEEIDRFYSRNSDLEIHEARISITPEYSEDRRLLLRQDDGSWAEL